MSIEELSAASKAAWDKGDHHESARHHAKAREEVETLNPEKTVAQLDDGRLAVVDKTAFDKAPVTDVHTDLAKALDAKA